MRHSREPYASVMRVRADLIIANVLVWIAYAGRDSERTPEAHGYFYDRYQCLADYHARRGRDARARRLRARADEHRLHGGGGDGPPYAAAMAMPRPSAWAVTDAFGTQRTGPMTRPDGQ